MSGNSHPLTRTWCTKCLLCRTPKSQNIQLQCYKRNKIYFTVTKIPVQEALVYFMVDISVVQQHLDNGYDGIMRFKMIKRVVCLLCMSVFVRHDVFNSLNLILSSALLHISSLNTSHMKEVEMNQTQFFQTLIQLRVCANTEHQSDTSALFFPNSYLTAY